MRRKYYELFGASARPPRVHRSLARVYTVAPAKPRKTDRFEYYTDTTTAAAAVDAEMFGTQMFSGKTARL